MNLRRVLVVVAVLMIVSVLLVTELMHLLWTSSELVGATIASSTAHLHYNQLGQIM